MRNKTQSRSNQVFVLALLMGIVVFLPFIVYDSGYFIYYGDFNVQQIPFYKLAHEAVRSGELGWNWHTDLGVNFIGSYSFYLLFSPFFWLTLPFPTAWVPYLMGPLLILKTACAALTAFLYIRRFVKDEFYAVIGGLLYAFSGWMDFNIFFNHFHDVAVFFPLLLLGLELLVTENRRGVFALAVLVNAAVNYWFFVGEAVFVVLYVIVRWRHGRWGLTLKRFGVIALEAVLGFGAAAVVVLPSVMALLGNPRTGAGEFLLGWDMWVYWHEQRPPAILHALFYPPEAPARTNFFPDHGAKWGSLSGWLPLFSMTGVIAYFFRRRDDWLKNILGISLVFAMVPLLNSLFVLLNDSYYARWFYMPVLLMAVATARAVEDSGPENGVDATDDFARSIRWCLLVVAVFAVMGGLTPRQNENEELRFGLAADPERMWIYVAIAMTCLLLTALLVIRLRESPRFRKYLLVSVMAVSAGFGLFYIGTGKNSRDRNQWLIDKGINGREQIRLPDDEFSRVDVYDSTDNIAMYWHLPTIQAFHSIVPPSIMEFYPEVGVTRDVGSRPETDVYALRPLLSVRYLFIEETKANQDPMPGYTFYDTQNNFNIYENDNYLPMGFAYDHFVLRGNLEEVSKTNRGNLLLRGAVIEEDAIDRLGGYISPLDSDSYGDYSEDTMAMDVRERRQYTADSFEVDKQGFVATTSFDQPKLLFFSVPYDKGWSAEISVNGGPFSAARIEKVNIGFMGLLAPEGDVTIRFRYRTQGLVEGAAVSVACLLLFAAYVLIARRLRQRKTPARTPAEIREELAAGHTMHLTPEEYTAYRDARQLPGQKEPEAPIEEQGEQTIDIQVAEGYTDSRSAADEPPGENPDR